MKKITKTISAMLSLALCVTGSVSAFTACGGGGYQGGNQIDADLDLAGKTAKNDPNTIECYLYSAGFGVEWFNQVAKSFMKKNPQYSVKVSVQLQDSLSTVIASGPKNMTTDLIITGGSVMPLVARGSSVVDGYDVCFEPLDDVYAYELPGENETILEKMDSEASAFYTQEVTMNGVTEEHIFGMPWMGGLNGIMYNSDLFKQAGLKDENGNATEPRTTDELKEYCDTLLENDITPFIYSASDDYFQYCGNIWWGQYAGAKGIDNFYNAKINDTARPSATTSPEIFKQPGLREMFKVYEELLDPAKKYVYEYVESLDYTKAQALFLQGRAEHGAMQPNGSWLENEMRTTSSQMEIGDVLPMQTPVVTALSDQMSYWEENGNFTEVTKAGTLTAEKRKAYDEKLRELVDYADGVAAAPSWATEDDLKLIKERRAYSDDSVGSQMCIPIYATAKDAAKEFLKYMASDEALGLWLGATYGTIPPYDYDVEAWEGYDTLSPFAKKVRKMLDKSVNLPSMDKYPTRYRGGLNYDYGTVGYNWCLTFGSQAGSRRTADEVVQRGYDYYKGIMNKLLTDSGIL